MKLTNVLLFVVAVGMVANFFKEEIKGTVAPPAQALLGGGIVFDPTNYKLQLLQRFIHLAIEKSGNESLKQAVETGTEIYRMADGIGRTGRIPLKYGFKVNEDLNFLITGRRSSYVNLSRRLKIPTGAEAYAREDAEFRRLMNTDPSSSFGPAKFSDRLDDSQEGGKRGSVNKQVPDQNARTAGEEFAEAYTDKLKVGGDSFEALADNQKNRDMEYIDATSSTFSLGLAIARNQEKRSEVIAETIASALGGADLREQVEGSNILLAAILHRMEDLIRLEANLARQLGAEGIAAVGSDGYLFLEQEAQQAKDEQ